MVLQKTLRSVILCGVSLLVLLAVAYLRHRYRSQTQLKECWIENLGPEPIYFMVGPLPHRLDSDTAFGPVFLEPSDSVRLRIRGREFRIAAAQTGTGKISVDPSQKTWSDSRTTFKLTR